MLPFIQHFPPGIFQIFYTINWPWVLHHQLLCYMPGVDEGGRGLGGFNNGVLRYESDGSI